MHMLISADAQVTPKGPGMLQKTQKRTIEESRFTQLFHSICNKQFSYRTFPLHIDVSIASSEKETVQVGSENNEITLQ